MADVPASSFAAGSALTRGRELTASELTAFNRQRRRASLTLAGLAFGVPMFVVLIAWGGTRERVDERTRYYGTGVKEVTAQYLGGKKHGAFVDYFRNGQMRSKGRYAKDRAVGDWTYWSYTGVKQAEGSYVRGRRDGVWQFFHHDGAPKRLGRYDNGMRAGHWQEWNDAGTLTSETMYEDGLKAGVERTYHPSGALASEVSFNKGIENGPARLLDDAGNVMAEGTYAYGQRHGEWKVRDADTGDVTVEQWYAGMFVEEGEGAGEIIAAAPSFDLAAKEVKAREQVREIFMPESMVPTITAQ